DVPDARLDARADVGAFGATGGGATATVAAGGVVAGDVEADGRLGETDLEVGDRARSALGGAANTDRCAGRGLHQEEHPLEVGAVDEVLVVGGITLRRRQLALDRAARLV